MFDTKGKYIAWHLTFWVCLFLYEWLPASSIHDCYQAAFNAAILNVPIIMVATYFNIFVTVESFLLKKKYGLFALSLGASLIVFGFLRRVVNFYMVYKVLYPEKATNLYFLPKITIDAVNVHLFVGLGAMIYFIRKWTEQRRINEELMKEKVEAELSLLKSQVQPHFIFNTLNSIYSMAIRKSDNTANAILQLSGLMRYSLLDAKSDLVYLRDEFTYINDYIALQRSRLGNSIQLEFSEEGDCADLQIAPLLIIPFIENAFKHGVNAEENSSIFIRLLIRQQVLDVEVKNNKVQLHDQHIEKSGLGIENTQKRLELIYPSKHQLKITDLPDTFSVHLSIHLS